MKAYKITGKLGDICSFVGGNEVKKGDTVYFHYESDMKQQCVAKPQGNEHMSITAMKQALEYVQEFKSLWWKVPTFADRVNKATREAISFAHNPIFQLEDVLSQAIKQSEKQDHAERLAEKNWQYFECPACGSEGARAFPHPERETSRPIYIAEVTMPEPDEIGPWCDGASWCLNCGHEWVAVWPLGAESLECPACGSTDTDRDQAEPHKRKTK